MRYATAKQQQPVTVRRKTVPCSSPGMHYAEQQLTVRRLLAGTAAPLQVQQRHTEVAGVGELGTGIEAAIHALDGAGRPLATHERGWFEPRFGQDLSSVRVHTGAEAGRLARAVDARAFTVGRNIAFAPGEYAADSPRGRHLLAHELTHTLQQRANPGVVQRGGAGLVGGKCCNTSKGTEWALVGDGEWKALEAGSCTGTLEDCDGMTCGGGFYHVDNLGSGTCITPRVDDSHYKPRRWTPEVRAPDARSPTQEGGKQGDTPPNYSYDKAPAGALSYEVGGDAASSKVIRIAWSFDDGPTTVTKKMETAIGLKKTTWFVMLNQIKGKSTAEETVNLAELKRLQTDGSEIGIHSYHDSVSHMAWFPMSTKDSYKDVDVSMTALEAFYNYLKTAGLLVKFVRVPYGLISELVQWLVDKSVANAGTVGGEIVEKKYTGTDAGALEVKKGYEKLLAKLSALGLHLWGGSKGSEPEVARLSWEAESSGVAGRPDYVTKHVSSARAAQQSTVTDPKKKDNPGKFERVADLIARDGVARSLVVLAHDITQADVDEVKTDKAAMEAYATTKGVKIEYYTMSGLYQVLRGKAP